MRIRSTKPEFWTSKTIARLPWDARLVLKGLESYVDDNGVGKDDIALIVSAVFPRDMLANTRDTLARVADAISQLADAGLVIRYTVNSEDLLYIDRWKEKQRIDRPNKGRFPRPDGTFDYEQEVDRDSYKNTRDTLATPSLLEQGNRGTGEQSSSSEIADAIPDPERPEVERLCELLADLIEGNGAKRPTITKKWRDSARLLIDKDGYTVEQVTWLIRWCQQDEFWRSNILSMPKLREKFDQLKLKATSGNNVTPLRPSVDPNWALR